MNAAMRDEFAALRERPKFLEEPGTLYNGMRPEDLRLDCERRLNDLIDRIMADSSDLPKKEMVLQLFTETLEGFPAFDTEDRERTCRYLEQIMDIVRIESSDGLLNQYLYGPILGGLLTDQGKMRGD